VCKEDKPGSDHWENSQADDEFLVTESVSKHKRKNQPKDGPD